jgi:hypothetical protein
MKSNSEVSRRYLKIKMNICYRPGADIEVPSLTGRSGMHTCLRLAPLALGSPWGQYWDVRTAPYFILHEYQGRRHMIIMTGIAERAE